MNLYATIGLGLVLTTAIAAFVLPRHVHVERHAVIAASPAELQAVLTSNRQYQSINPYKDTDPDLQIDFFGPEQGVGSGFRFEGKEGTGSQTVARIEPNRSVTLDIDLGPMGQPTQTVAFEPTAEATRVVWSMDADMGYNPIARVMGLFMDGFVGPVFERGLGNLATVTNPV